MAKVTGDLIEPQCLTIEDFFHIEMYDIKVRLYSRWSTDIYCHPGAFPTDADVLAELKSAPFPAPFTERLIEYMENKLHPKEPAMCQPSEYAWQRLS